MTAIEPWMKAWLEEKYGEDEPAVRREDLGTVALEGELALWHPIYDLHGAPRFALAGRPTLEAIWVGGELAGYLLRRGGDGSAREVVETWREIGDASTDATRFFLVQVDQTEAVIDWMNEDVTGFESLGSEANATAELATHPKGTARTLTLMSPDGNAGIRGGYARDGELACVVIET